MSFSTLRAGGNVVLDAVRDMSLEDIDVYLRSRIEDPAIGAQELIGVIEFSFSRRWLRELILASTLISLKTLEYPETARHVFFLRAVCLYLDDPSDDYDVSRSGFLGAG